ncbi:glycerophosphodiester phosphodiesterase GDPD4 [Senna tora]|uniref:glycerophosphodiester phosphodiesterase n=1 Tax=Senna tora TaxID=362788 RepID=A0A834X2J4_9FABA|nr:glycerophosphodiester phosphodiesterase GDPD4 [Senna tora]
MASSRVGRRQHQFPNTITIPWSRNRLRFRFSSRRVIRTIIISLALVAILPPIFFHFRLRRLHQIQLRKCGWLLDPPLVCAHGGDSSKAFPNTVCILDASNSSCSLYSSTSHGHFFQEMIRPFPFENFRILMAAYSSALRSQVDCIEIDVSRSSDGVLFALHDRDLQRISGNTSSKVGHFSTNKIREFSALHQSVGKFNDESIATLEEALKVTANSVRQIILDAKVGPPLYEKGLARDILSIVERTECGNCLIWAKSDSLARDVIKLSSDTTVGYIVMIDPSTGARTNLLRMKGAEVVGVYHPLIDEKLVKVLHRRKKKVYAWTVDDVESMRRMLSEHVDAVVTSNPTLLQSLMQDTRTQCLEEDSELNTFYI